MKEVGIALPKSRGVGVGVLAALLLCFIFYYFYGGYMTLALLLESSCVGILLDLPFGFTNPNLSLQ